jgi:colicin import membrane protein
MRPASARQGISCTVLVKQIPGGEVVEARVTSCNGDAAVVRSIEAAVLRASPLPLPANPALFERNLQFEFRPDD